MYASESDDYRSTRFRIQQWSESVGVYAITGGVDVFHACGIPANTYHPERFLLDESNNYQLTKVGGCMASAQPVS